MSRIGKIQVDIVGNLAPFTKATQDAEKQGVSFARAVKGAMTASVAGLGNVAAGAAQKILSIKTAVIAAAGAFGAYKIVGTLHAAAMEVDKIGKASQRLGLSVPTLSALRFAAGEANIEFETLAKMAGKASRELADIVAKGQTEMKIGRVTVRLTDANGQLRSINQLLPVIARGLQTVGSQGEKLRLSEKIFGRAGGEAFVQFLEDSGDFVKNLAEQTERASRLGVIFSESQAAQADAYLDSVGRIKEAWLGVRVAIVTEVAPTLTTLLDDLALRAAAIPRTISAIYRAAGIAAGSDGQARQAGQALQAVKSGAGNILVVAAHEAGGVFVTTILEGIRQVGVTMAIEFGAKLGELFPRLATNDGIFGAGNPNVGNRAEIQRLQDMRAKIVELQKVIEDWNQTFAGDRFAANNPANAAQLGEYRRQLNLLIESVLHHKGDVRQAMDAIDKMIRGQETVLGLNTGNGLAQQQAQAAAESLGRVSARISQAQQAIAVALAKADSAFDNLQSQYGGDGFIGPPAPGSGSRGRRSTWTEYFAAIADNARAAGATAGKNFQTAWAGAMKFQEGVKGRIDDALKEAKEIRFELYPEEKAKADIERVKELKKLLDSVGHENALSETDVEKKIAAIMKKLKDLGDKAEETFAVKLENDIKNFSVSAGDAFADLVVDGEASFDQLLKSWTKTLVSMATQHFLFAPLFGGLGAEAGKLFATAPVGSMRGNVITSGQIVPYAKGGLTGIINDTVIFPMRGGQVGMAGEGGRAEYGVEPVRMSDGNLGVRAMGGDVRVQVFDQRGSGAPVQVDSSTGPDGRQIVRVWVRDEIRGMVQDGSLDRSFGSAFGGRRRPVGR